MRVSRSFQDRTVWMTRVWMVSAVGTTPCAVVVGRAAAPPPSRWAASTAASVDSASQRHRVQAAAMSRPTAHPAPAARRPPPSPKTGS